MKIISWKSTQGKKIVLEKCRNSKCHFGNKPEFMFADFINLLHNCFVQFFTQFAQFSIRIHVLLVTKWIQLTSYNGQWYEYLQNYKEDVSIHGYHMCTCVYVNNLTCLTQLTMWAPPAQTHTLTCVPAWKWGSNSKCTATFRQLILIRFCAFSHFKF